MMTCTRDTHRNTATSGESEPRAIEQIVTLTHTARRIADTGALRSFVTSAIVSHSIILLTRSTHGYKIEMKASMVVLRFFTQTADS
jgi:hypothetical protein